MALRKQNIDIILTQGVKNKISSKILDGSELLTLENRVFNKIGSLDKRYGYTKIPAKDISDSSDITSLNSLMLFKDELVMTNSLGKIYSYSSSTENWIDKGAFVPASVSSNTIITNDLEQTTPDTAIIGDIQAFVWTDSNSTLRYSLKDINTGTLYIQDAELAGASTLNPRVIAVNNSFIFLYGSSTNLAYKLIYANNPTGFAKTGNIRADMHADALFDAVVIDNEGYVAYKDTSTYLRIVEFSENAGISNLSAATTEVIVDTLSFFQYLNAAGTDYNLTILLKKDANTVRCVQYNHDLTVLVAAQDVDTTASTDVRCLAINRVGATDVVNLYWEVPGSSTSDNYIKTRTLSLAGSLGTASVFLRSVGIASKGFTVNDSGYLNVLHESSLQSTVFTVDEDGVVVCKFFPGNAGTHAATGAFPSSVGTIDSTNVFFGTCVKGSIRSENGTLYSLLGISEARINFNSQEPNSNVQLNNNLFISGGILSIYDGQSVVEHGFNLYPETITVGTTTTTGGSMSDGTYLYRAIYTWTDTQGNIHRSAPSSPLTVTLSGGTATQKQVVNIPTLRLTRKQDDRRDVYVDLYRTEDGGTVYYKVTSSNDSVNTSPPTNDVTSDSVSWDDHISDASLVSNEILYTVGGELDNIAPPSCDFITTHNNRAFILGLQDKNEIRYSKIKRRNEGTSFNELLSIFIDPEGGDLVAASSLDANLIIFKKNNIYSLTGDGFNDNGIESTFNDPQLIASDVGCQDANSIVLGPDGLFFKSEKGIYLIDRGLSLIYVGADVEDYNTETITSAQLIEDRNEIRFTTSTGTILVYNYYFKQWSTFTNKNIVDSVIWNDIFVYISSDDEIFQESTSTYKDNGAFVNSRVSTGWIRLTGLQGFQRVYRVKVLGEYKTKHRLKVNIYTDYSNISRQETIIDPTDFISIDEDYYGYETYGVSTPYGGSSNGVYEYTIHMKRQKCQSIRVEIEDMFDTSESSNNGNGLEINGMSLEIGFKRGLNKTSSDKQG